MAPGTAADPSGELGNGEAGDGAPYGFYLFISKIKYLPIYTDPKLLQGLGDCISCPCPSCRRATIPKAHCPSYPSCCCLWRGP